MSFYLQVLATDSIDSSACIALFTESHRFLFNCGEGIQRLCVEHKVRLSKIRAVLFTDFSPHNSFGLPGLALTAADAGNTNIRIGGPPQLKAFLHTTRHFMKLNDGLLNFHTSTEHVSTVFNSNEADIRMIAFKTENTHQEHETTPLPNTQTEHNPYTSGSVQRNCFVGSTQELKGKFDILRAQALKVPKGPLFGKLKNGNSVTLEDGTTITPDMVLGESELKKYFIVVCSIQPHEAGLLQTITNSPELNRFHTGQSAVDNGDGLKCIVHLSPVGTISNPLYLAWVARFGPQVTHIYTGAGTSTTSCTSFLATTVQTHKLHLTAPGLFPSLRSTYCGLYSDVEGSESSMGETGTNVIAATPLLKYHFLPVRSSGVEHPAYAAFDCTSSAVVLYNEALQGESGEVVCSALRVAAEVEEVVTCDSGDSNNTTSANTTTSTNTSSTNNTAAIQHTYGTATTSAAQLLHSGVRGSVSFLGTGCSIPSKYRNVSGVLLQIGTSSGSNSNGGGGSSSSDSSTSNNTANTTSTTNNSNTTSTTNSGLNGLLIDAGEGTWAQMLRIAYEHACDNSTNTATTGTTLNTTNTNDTTTPTLRALQHSLASRLKVVWVSHPHADHHLGLVRVIVERKTALCGVYGSSGSNNNVYNNNSTESKNSNSNNTSTTTTPNTTPNSFTPLVVIAPPSILAFLHEYTLLYPYLHDAYTPVSCRMYDPADSCLYTDCYWNSRLFGSSSGGVGGSVGGGNSEGGVGSGSSEQDVKRQRTHSPVRDNTTSNDATTTTTSANNSNSKKVTRGDQYSIEYEQNTTDTNMDNTTTNAGSNSTNTADIIHTMLYNNDTNSTICNMDNNTPTSTNNTTTTTNTNNTTTNNNKPWRNFSSVFREVVPPAVLTVAVQAKHTADAVLCSMGVVGLKNIQVIHCGQSYGLCVTFAGSAGMGGVGGSTGSGVNNCGNSSSGSSGSVGCIVSTGGSSDNINPYNTYNPSYNTTTNHNITSPHNFTLVYSGDTRPCPALITHCMYVTLLIHEATFEDSKSSEAVSKRHSTMCEAYNVGREMCAYRTVFTHFSQRYPGVPLLGDYTNSSGDDGSSSSGSSGGDSVNMDIIDTNNTSTLNNTTNITPNTTTTNTTNTTPHVAPILAFDYMHLPLSALLWAPVVTAVMSAAYPGKVKTSAENNEDDE